MNLNNWIRVSKANPCPVCQKADWCTINPGLNLILCMRVQSSRPSKNEMGGWLHQLDQSHPIHIVKVKERQQPTINCTRLMREYLEHTKPEWIEALASDLGVTADALSALECAWAEEYRAWAWPMYDGYGNKIGIRLRKKDGSKFAVLGSHQGLFIPLSATQRTIYICEGPTDTAAALSIGLYAIGRPSCYGSVEDIKRFLKRMNTNRVVVLSDNDTPGLDGARKLIDALTMPSCTLVLPVKDMREFVRCGGNACTLTAILKTMLWVVPNKEGVSTETATPRRFT